MSTPASMALSRSCGFSKDVYKRQTYARSYPNGNMAAHVVGYVSQQ